MGISWKNWLTGLFLVGGIIALYFIIKEYGIKEIFDTYKNFDPLTFLLYALSVLLILLLLNWRWDVVLKSRNISIPFRKLFIYKIMGMGINFLTPGPRVGGEATQSSMLTKHDVNFTEGLTTVMIDKIIDITTSGILFLIGIMLVGLKNNFVGSFGRILLVLGLIFVILVVIFYYRMLTSKHFFLKLFHMLRLDKVRSKTLIKIGQKIEEMELMMIEFYKHNKKAFMKTLGISVLSWIAMFFEYKFAAQLLGFNIGMVEIFFIVSFVGIALLFPIPMAIGVLEAGQISAFAIIGLPASSGVALAFLIRIKDLTTAMIGLIFLALYGFHVPKVVKKKYNSKMEPLGDDYKMKETLDARFKRIKIKRKKNKPI